MDKEKRIPMIKRAQDLIKDDLVFYASPEPTSIYEN